MQKFKKIENKKQGAALPTRPKGLGFRAVNQMKKMKGNKQSHTSNAKFGMGDFYGRAIPAKMGKIRSAYPPAENPVKSKKLGKPPKTLA